MILLLLFLLNSLNLDLLRAAVFDKIQTTDIKNGGFDVIFLRDKLSSNQAKCLFEM